MNWTVKQIIHPYLFPAIERLWRWGLRLIRPVFFSAPPSRRWQSGGRVLVIAPHPDDETLGAGGAIALHCRRGDYVTVAVITDGRGSRAGGLTPAEMARRRAAEIVGAAQMLDVSNLVCLGLPEGTWETAAARERLAPLLAGADVVYVPSCVDFHPEHLRVAQLLGEMLRPEQMVRVMELGVPLTPALVNLVADIGPVAAQKRRALACFATQTEALASLARLARYRAAFAGLSTAEVFWEMPARSYGRVMKYGAWGWKDSPFRGVRPRPFTDPLAFLVGRRMRFRLRTLAQETIP